MLPPQRGNTGEQSVRHGITAVMEVLDGAFKIDRVPKDDGRHDEVEAGGKVPLFLEGAVAELPEPVEEDGTSERVARLALAQRAR